MIQKIIITLLILFNFSLSKAQNSDTLVIHYYENFPYAFVEEGKLKGIEIDIMEEYVNWLKSKKNVSTAIVFKPFKEFSTFYTSVKDGQKNVIGLGSVTGNAEREKEVLFSAPYLKNLAVLITAGKVPTLKSRSAAEVTKTLGSLSAITVNKSSHAVYLNDLKKQFLPNLKIVYTENQNRVLENIVSDNSVFGYADIVAYWSFLKQNPGKFLKIQKVFNEPKESFCFVMPLGSKHSNNMSEFFESGFGFTSTKMYRQILEKYLGYEIIESVEVK